ncbi:hypothetical protein FACS1894216_17270 [Synergistales bacterium]|nr:hypothetical protein FACS1894216_17270 [Synergistales bacterium]
MIMADFAENVTILRPEISVDKLKVQKQMGAIRRPERFSGLIDSVLEEARELWRPEICWASYGIKMLPAEGAAALYRESGEPAGTLVIGKRSALLNKARKCFVTVGTIGGELSDKVAEFEKEGNALASYLLDVIGVLALHATHEHFRRSVEDYACSMKWGAGPIMQPGSLEGWSIEGQEELLKLVPVSEIGVSLNENFMMTPMKSHSSIVGVGPGYGKSRSECLCEECDRKHCSWRRTKEYGFVL